MDSYGREAPKIQEIVAKTPVSEEKAAKMMKGFLTATLASVRREPHRPLAEHFEDLIDVTAQIDQEGLYSSTLEEMKLAIKHGGSAMDSPVVDSPDDEEAERKSVKKAKKEAKKSAKKEKKEKKKRKRESQE